MSSSYPPQSQGPSHRNGTLSDSATAGQYQQGYSQQFFDPRQGSGQQSGLPQYRVGLPQSYQQTRPGTVTTQYEGQGPEWQQSRNEAREPYQGQADY